MSGLEEGQRLRGVAVQWLMEPTVELVVVGLGRFCRKNVLGDFSGVSPHETKMCAY